MAKVVLLLLLLLLWGISAVRAHVVALRVGWRELGRVLRSLWVGTMVAVELSWVLVVLLLQARVLRVVVRGREHGSLSERSEVTLSFGRKPSTSRSRALDALKSQYSTRNSNHLLLLLYCFSQSSRYSR